MLHCAMIAGINEQELNAVVSNYQDTLRPESFDQLMPELERSVTVMCNAPKLETFALNISMTDIMF